MTKEILFKCLGADGRAPMGTGRWSLPTKRADGTWEPGEWMPKIAGPLVTCSKGYHLTRLDHLSEWLNEEIYEAEVAPGATVVEADGKIVVSSARLLRRFETWTPKTARLFAADCAERVLHFYEDRYPGDLRPRKAIEAARAYAAQLP